LGGPVRQYHFESNGDSVIGDEVICAMFAGSDVLSALSAEVFAVGRLRRMGSRATVGAALALSVAVGCGGGGTSTTGTGPVRGESTTVTVVASSAGNDQLVQFYLTLNSLTLTSASGKTTVPLLSEPQQVEFMHLNGGAEPLVTLSVPQDLYTKATMTLSGGSFVCAAQQSGTNTIAHYSIAPSQATVQLPGPLTIDGGAMALSLEMLVGQSATLPSNCYEQGFAGDSMTPTFNLTAMTVSAQPANTTNGKLTALEGLVVNPASGPSSFGVSAADGTAVGTTLGTTWQVNTSASTVFQGIGNAAGLTAGMPVDIDGTLDADGSVAATRVAVLDADTTNLTVNSGPLIQVAASVPMLNQVNQLAEGSQQYVRGWPAFSYSNTTFASWGGLTNVASLPFAASFDAGNMVPGQVVAVTSHVTEVGSYPTYVPATTMTLMPQTIDGTVTATGTAGGFTTYTVELAAYDLFPQFAVQGGQTTLLTNPQQVVVYADANTQTVGGGVSSNLGRFTGVIFNDGGTLRMDATQVAGGVAE
jgi:hypothetical protein